MPINKTDRLPKEKVPSKVRKPGKPTSKDKDIPENTPPPPPHTHRRYRCIYRWFTKREKKRES